MSTKVREKITGIYKIESPSGAIYIGQSVNILKRWHDYSKVVNTHRQTRLFNSLNKYSPETHTFSVVYQFPKDVSPMVLCAYEQFYIDQYKEAGHNMMNIRDAGSRGSHSEETKKLMSEKQKGKKPSAETLIKMSNAKKGKVGNRLGSKNSQASIEKAKLSNAGFRHSEETKKKISQNSARHNKGVRPSAESIEKNRAAHLGKIMSGEQKQKISLSLKGVPKTKEHNNKVSIALKSYHAKRKLLSS